MSQLVKREKKRVESESEGNKIYLGFFYPCVCDEYYLT